MSMLIDSHKKIQSLLDAISETDKSYRIAIDALEKLDSGETINLEGVGMNLQFGDHTIPVPLPQDQQALSDRVADAVQFLGAEVIRLWNELYATAAAAQQHCIQAQQQAAAPTEEAPASPPPASPSIIQQPTAPQTGPPASPPQQPQVRQVHTVPVDGS